MFNVNNYNLRIFYYCFGTIIIQQIKEVLLMGNKNKENKNNNNSKNNNRKSNEKNNNRDCE